MSNIQTFDPQNQTISKIFSCDAIYKIPNYQRQYSWKNEQLEDLWNDLYESYKNQSEENDCYFLGSIVVVDDGKGYHELIDGQQRITTLMILLNVLYKTFPDLNSQKEGVYVAKHSKIKSYIYYDAEAEVKRLQLQTDPKYDTEFKNIIMNTKSFEQLEEPTKAQMKLDDPKYKYINTARFFYKKLTSLHQEELEDFINYIFFNTNIIKIVCTNETFAIKLFQVLNDRGLDLSSSDIIKSYIIGKYDKNDENGKTIFINNWKEIEMLAKQYEFTLDEFMVYYQYFKLLKNPRKQITAEMKTIIENTEINELVVELHTFAKAIEKMYQSTEPILYSLRYIPWKSYVNTILAIAYYVNYEPFDQLITIVRRFFYLSLISGKNLNQIKQTSFNIMEAIANKQPIEIIKEQTENTIKKYKMISLTYEALQEDVFGEFFLKPLMLSLEYHRREKTNTTFTIIDKHLHMDHILPQKYKNSQEWPGINDQEAETNLNKLGNMALLLDIKNEEALNHGFKTKKRIYSGINKEGENQSGIVMFEYTRDLLKEENWDTEKIKTRTTSLIQEIEKMLNISKQDIQKEQEPVNSNKWLYQEKEYNNQQILEIIVKDYIDKKEIKTFNELPEEIKTYQIESKNFLLSTISSPEQEPLYIKIDTLPCYIYKVEKEENIKECINVLKQYFPFDIKPIQEETSKGNITQEMIEQVYELSKQVYEKKLDIQTAIEEMSKQHMNESSTIIYVDCFSKMLIGNLYKRGISSLATEYYITHIEKDYGTEYGENPKIAVKKYIEYLNSIGNQHKGLE